MTAYLLGLATLPALGLLYVLLVVLLAGPGDVWSGCSMYGCGYERHPRRFEPWWWWKRRSRREWRQHLRVSPTCAAHVEKWRARRAAARES